MVPYLFGLGLSAGRKFMWLGYNFDDSCVYLSWMRQSADGLARTINLFTTDPQHGLAPNPFFWVLGRAAGLTHLPLLGVYHGARLICGFVLLLAVWELIRALIVPVPARRLAYLFVCFSAGLGWLPCWRDGSLAAPIDLWQPEAITFLSLYLSPLFCFSMFLQVKIIHLLLVGERTGRFRYAIYAGLCGSVLGLTHTYDVVSLAAAWICYLLGSAVLLHRRGRPLSDTVPSWTRALAAGLITLPAVAFIAYQLRSETVFRQRALVATTAPALHWVVLGYGVTLLFAAFATVLLIRSAIPTHRQTEDRLSREPDAWTIDPEAALLLIVWLITNIAVSYIPVSFQRKMIQGAHFPIAILAGIGAACVLNRLRGTPSISRFPAFAFISTLILCLSNVHFMLRDTENYSQNLAQTKLHRTYIQPGEIAALQWLRTHTAPGTAVQPLPWIGLLATDSGRQVFTREATLMCITPGLIDRPVYCGHWGETPDFFTKLAELRMFATPRRTDSERIALLRSMHVRYVVFSQKRASDTSFEAAEAADELLPMFRGRIPLPGYLRLRYSNEDADVYEFVP